MLTQEQAVEIRVMARRGVWAKLSRLLERQGGSGGRGRIQHYMPCEDGGDLHLRDTGTDSEMGEPITSLRCRTSGPWAVRRPHNSRWPAFRNEGGANPHEGYFANHSPHCGAMQEDYLCRRPDRYDSCR